MESNQIKSGFQTPGFGGLLYIHYQTIMMGMIIMDHNNHPSLNVICASDRELIKKDLTNRINSDIDSREFSTIQLLQKLQTLHNN
jgi:hypothetical protein